MKKSLKVKHAVVIVNYNGFTDTLECISSVKSTKDAPHIIVVDNASTNDSVRELRSIFPDLDLISSPTNLGFSGGNNLGIKRALKLGAQVVYLLNNDTTVDHNLFFRSYRFVAGKNRIAGAKIYYAKGHEFHDAQKDLGNVLWYAGGHFDWRNVLAKHTGVDEVDRGQFDKVKSVDFITGCFMAIPRKVLNKVGLLDESLFLYFEDVDYCLHAKKMKVELLYDPKLVLYHKNSSSAVAGSAMVDYYITRNRYVIAKRYGNLRLSLALLKEGLTRNLGSRVRRMAMFDYLTGRMGNRHEKITAVSPKIA